MRYLPARLIMALCVLAPLLMISAQRRVQLELKLNEAEYFESPGVPELKAFPFLWQQVGYVLGEDSSNYVFLVLDADQVLNARQQ